MSVRDLSKEYAEAMQTIEKVKAKLYSEIVKYLIEHSWNPAKCTEASISKEFELPRSTIRPILDELVSRSVLRSSDLERLKPLSVTSLGAALDRGYVEFSKEDVRNIFSPKEAKDGSEVHSAYPGIGGISEDGTWKYRWLGPSHKSSLHTLIGRFISFLPPTNTERAIQKLSQSKEFKGLDLYLPENTMFETIFLDYPVLGEIYFDIVVQTEKKEDITEEEVKAALAKAFQQRVEFVTDRLLTFARMLEEQGYERISKTLPRYGVDGPYRTEEGKPVETPIRFNKAYLWTTTQAIRQGLKIAKKIKMPSNLIQKTLDLCETLDKAIEKEYKGREKEGPLEEWYQKQV